MKKITVKTYYPSYPSTPESIYEVREQCGKMDKIVRHVYPSQHDKHWTESAYAEPLLSMYDHGNGITIKDGEKIVAELRYDVAEYLQILLRTDKLFQKKHPTKFEWVAFKKLGDI